MSTEPIVLVCRHDKEWEATATQFDPPVTATSLTRTTAVRRVQREVARLLAKSAVELTFVITIEPPKGVREALVTAEAQEVAARQKSAQIMTELLDDGWSLGDVAELVSKSTVWVKKFLQREDQ